MPPIPYWQLPSLYWVSRVEHPPTWRVIFLVPLGETEIAQFMKKLVDIDKDWPDRPDAEPRRLLEVPWVHDFTPDSSIIAPMFVQGNESPLIFIDEQSKRDDTALLLWCNEEKKDHCTLRVPIKRANLLLSAAAEGKIVLEGEEFQPVGYDVPAIMVLIRIISGFWTVSNFHTEARPTTRERNIPDFHNSTYDPGGDRKNEELRRREYGGLL